MRCILITRAGKAVFDDDHKVLLDSSYADVLVHSDESSIVNGILWITIEKEKVG